MPKIKQPLAYLIPTKEELIQDEIITEYLRFTFNTGTDTRKLKRVMRKVANTLGYNHKRLWTSMEFKELL